MSEPHDDDAPDAELPAEQVAFDLNDFPGGARSAIEAFLMVIDEPVDESLLASALELPLEDVTAIKITDHEGLLAAHHVGHAVCVAGQKTRGDADGAARRPLDLDQPARELGGTGRALGVGRLAPALAAADHA